MMTKKPKNTMEEESQSRAAIEEDKLDEARIRAIMRELPIWGVTSTAITISEHQYRQIFDLVPSIGPDEDKEHIKSIQVVCKTCGLVTCHIQEGSKLQDCNAAQLHRSLHRDVLFDYLPTLRRGSMDQPYHSEPELCPTLGMSDIGVDEIIANPFFSDPGHSPGNSNDTVYTPRNYKSKEPEAGGGASADKAPLCDYKYCDECSKVQPRRSYCPHRPCTVCYKDHPNQVCPFFNYVPQGAEFNNKYYEIVCQCDRVFNVSKWICTACGGHRPMLIAKHCLFCRGSHGAYECPENTDAAAKYELVWEANRSKVPQFKHDIVLSPEELRILELTDEKFAALDR